MTYIYTFSHGCCQFSNLLGTIYKKGNVTFTPDGNSIISPVGNKITNYDLKSNKAVTLALESKFDYTCIDISPNGCLLVAVNEKGFAQMISLISNTVIHTYKFSSAALCVKFSPDGLHFAIAKENMGKHISIIPYILNIQMFFFVDFYSFYLCNSR